MMPTTAMAIKSRPKVAPARDKASMMMKGLAQTWGFKKLSGIIAKNAVMPAPAADRPWISDTTTMIIGTKLMMTLMKS